jgi:3-oxoacyl-[acyl-carrier protein] reductase
MTKSLARALAPEIRVNAVCPGPIDSRWLRQGLTEKEIEDRVSKLPIPEIISPADIADTIAYLAVGTSKTTGQLLTVDCGRSM